MQGINTQRICQGWHDDDKSLSKSRTFSKIPRFGCGSIDCAIQSRKGVTTTQEGDGALPALEKEYRTTN